MKLEIQDQNNRNNVIAVENGSYTSVLEILNFFQDKIFLLTDYNSVLVSESIENISKSVFMYDSCIVKVFDKEDKDVLIEIVSDIFNVSLEKKENVIKQIFNNHNLN